VGLEAHGETANTALLPHVLASGSGLLGLGASKGNETQGRMLAKKGGWLSAHLGARTDLAGEILEGERKAMSGDQPEGQPTGRLLGGRRQGPGRKARRAEAEP
jgi:hypothetical protein